MRLAALYGQSFEVRLDSLSGTFIASDTINTGDGQTYETFEYDINGVTSIHDVYIVFNGSVNVNWFLFADNSYDPSNIEVESITLDMNEIKIKENETCHLTATVLPENVAIKTITWTSSNE